MFWVAALAVLAGLAVHMPTTLQPPPGVPTLLFFDGVCNLCDGFVNFVADHDSARLIRFGALQKHAELIAKVGAPTDLSTVVVVQGDKFYTKSTAVMRVLAQLDSPWPYATVLALIPEAFRDFCYGQVATYRYVVFGKSEACRVPSGDFKRRFMDYDPTTDDEEGTAGSKPAFAT